MSYCRWSTENFKCDLYVYEGSHAWVIHVAGNRIVSEITDADLVLAKWMNEPTRDRWNAVVAAREKQRKELDTATREPLNYGCEGDHYDLESPAECADKIEELVAMGYYCPQWVIDQLREEQAELDKIEA